MSKMNYKSINGVDIPSVSVDEVDEQHTAVDLDATNFDLRTTMIDSSAVNDKLIKNIEKICRNSYEYKQYINYLKDELDLKTCTIIDTININDLYVGLEFHHTPFTLYDICKIVTDYLLDKNEKMLMIDIAEQVMREHYEGNVGLVPLTSVAHELVHSGAIIVPLNKVHGNWVKFMEKYQKYIDEETNNKLTDLMQLDNEAIKNKNKVKLEKNILDYNITYHNVDHSSED